MLTDFLLFADGQMAFRAFLKSEFCEENMEFWLACEEFKCKKTKEVLASTAVDIYEQFIKTNSPQQVCNREQEKNNILTPGLIIFKGS